MGKSGNKRAARRKAARERTAQKVLAESGRTQKLADTVLDAAKVAERTQRSRTREWFWRFLVAALSFAAGMGIEAHFKFFINSETTYVGHDAVYIKVGKLDAKGAESLATSLTKRGTKEKDAEPSLMQPTQGVERVSSERPIPKIEYPSYLESLAKQVLKEFNADNFDDAVRMSKECEGLINEAIEKAGGVYEQDGGFVLAKQNAYTTLGDDAYYRGEYLKSAHYWEMAMADFKDVEAHERAMRDAALLRSKGKRLKFFSQDEIDEIRIWKEDKRWSYLTTLADVGVLYPIELDYAAGSYHYIDYMKVFGLNQDVEYHPVACEEFTDSDGNVARSNLVIFQRSGRNKIEFFDLDDAVDVTLGVRNERRKDHVILIRPTEATVKAYANIAKRDKVPSIEFEYATNTCFVSTGECLSTNAPLQIKTVFRDLSSFEELKLIR